MRFASSKLDTEMCSQRFKVINKVRWQSHKPAKGVTFQRCRKDAKDHILRCVQSHLCGKDVDMLLGLMVPSY